MKEDDPKGLIRESFRIEGISAAECRSIFLDWALGQTDSDRLPERVNRLLRLYSADNPAHPMLDVLKDSQETPDRPKRRGGWRGRRGGAPSGEESGI